MSMVISYKKQVTFYILFLLIIFSIIEGVARVYDYVNPECNLMVNETSKNWDFGLKQEICKSWLYHLVYLDPITDIVSSEPNQNLPTITINNHGFRGPEISKEKSNGVYRVFVVGGSATFALRAGSDQLTIPGYIEQNINKYSSDKKFEVINAGIPRITSSDELQLIQTKIVDFKPDLIIIYDGVNDAQLPYNFTKEKDWGQMTEFEYFYKKYFSFYETPRILPRILDREGPDMGVLDSEKPKKFSEETGLAKAQLWKENITKICELGTQKDITTMIVLQPFLGTGSKELTEHEKKMFVRLSHEKVVHVYDLFGTQLDDLRNSCTHVMDARNVFDDIHENVFFDPSHVGSKHNKVVADRIFYELAPLLPLD